MLYTHFLSKRCYFTTVKLYVIFSEELFELNMKITVLNVDSIYRIEFYTFIFLANWYWLQEIRPLFLFYCGVFKTVPGKCKILCDNGRGGKGGGWQSKGKLRRISVFYDLGSFPQLRSTTTHFPSEEIPQYFQYKKLAKQTDRLYSTEVKNGPCTKKLEAYLYFGEKTKAAVDPL